MLGEQRKAGKLLTVKARIRPRQVSGLEVKSSYALLYQRLKDK